MTKDQNTDPPAGSPPPASTQTSDPLLQYEAQCADSGAKFPITLIVGGATWHGRLMSQSTFYKMQSARIGEWPARSEPAKNFLQRRFEWFRMLAEVTDARSDAPKSTRAPDYVHLADASRDGTVGTIRAMRFKLSSIDAWSLGHPGS